MPRGSEGKAAHEAPREEERVIEGISEDQFYGSKRRSSFQLLDHLMMPWPWQWPFHLELDSVEKIIASIAGLIAIGETTRRLLLRFLRRMTPPELRRFSFAEYIDYEHRRGSKPALFRFAGALAADFERGYVYLRPEIDQLFKRLRKESPIAVIGSPAAGKTVVLRSLGYKILKSRRFNPLNRRAVYLISLKEVVVQDSELEKLRKLHKAAVIIVDDCHLDRTFGEKLIADPTPRCRIVLFSRPLDFPPMAPPNRLDPDIGRVEDHISPALESPLRVAFDASRAVEIKATEAAANIVSLYNEKTGLAIERDVQSRIAGGYRDNLMVLSWALQTFRRNKTFARADVSRTAANWLLPEFGSGEGFYRDLREEDRRKIHPDDAAAIFLILASAYRFEFPVARDFLQHDLRVERSHLDLLVKSRMITADHEEIGLPHASLASLLVEAALTTPLSEVVRAIERRLQGAFPDGVLRLYLNGRPAQTCRLLYRIPPAADGTLRTIIENNEATIRQGITSEQDLSMVVSAIKLVHSVDKNIPKNLLEENYPAFVESLGRRLLKSPLDWESAECVTVIADASESSAMALLPYAEAQVRAATVDYSMGSYFGAIVQRREDFAAALLPVLLEKLRETDLGYGLASCVHGIVGYFDSNGAGKRLARRLIPLVAEKILQAPDYASIVASVAAMSWRKDNELTFELVPSIAQRLNAEPTRVMVGTVVLMIGADVYQPLGKAIYDSLSPAAQAILHDISANPPNEDIRSSLEKAALWIIPEKQASNAMNSRDA